MEHSNSSTTAILSQSLGRRIRRRRLEQRLSQDELAFAVEVTQSSISNYETGRSQPSLSVLLALCDALGLVAAELVDQLEREQRGEPGSISQDCQALTTHSSRVSLLRT